MGNMKLSENSPKKEKSDGSLRKINKPLMEKRRRARINNCLSQLKVLVLDAIKRDTTQISKLEKADILEMTVKYLRNMQTGSPHTSGADTTNLNDYKTGFQECASEVMRFVSSVQNINSDVKSKLWNHLNNCTGGGAPQTQMNRLGNGAGGNRNVCYRKPLSVQIPKCNTLRTELNMNSNSNGYLLVPARHGYSGNLYHSHSQIQDLSTSVRIPRASSSSSLPAQISESNSLDMRNNNIEVSRSVLNHSVNEPMNNNVQSREQVWRPW